MWQMELGGKQEFEADPCGKNHSIHLSDGHCLFFVQGKWCWTEVEKTVVHQKRPKGMPLLQKVLRLHDAFQLGAMTASTL